MTEHSINNSQSSIIYLNNWDRRDERRILEGRGASTYHDVTFDLVNATVTTATANTSSSSLPLREDSFLEGLIVPLYVTIFLLSVVGNCLVLITLARNKRMRTVTNVYLLNLAVSDLMLSVFCMPFTLLGQILRNFIFGATLCKFISYIQAVSVSVGVWTLVAISLERFFAICRPLKSRQWQTQFHAYKMIGVVWLMSLASNAPILVVTELQKLDDGVREKCREEWNDIPAERGYNLFLDAFLLLIPLVVMTVAYSLIATKLWRGLKREIRQSSSCKQRLERVGSSGTRLSPYTNIDKLNSSSAATVVTGNGTVSKQSNCGVSPSTCHQVATSPQSPMQAALPSKARKQNRANASRPRAEFVKLWLTKRSVCPPRSGTAKVSEGQKNLKFSGTDMLMNSRLQMGIKKSEETSAAGSNKNSNGKNVSGDDHSGDTNYAFGRQHAIRSNYMGKSIEAKKKVIRMLFVVVLEFFVCWTPLYVLNTWYLFDSKSLYYYIGSTGISLVQLLAYISSCCNPITYCFMNRKFRQSFLSLFDCYRCWRLKCRDEDASAGATRIATQPGNSEPSGNESTIYLGRTSVVARSEVVRLLEEEDRV